MAKSSNFLDQDYLKSILYYDSETGIFVWKYRQDGDPAWNAKFPGRIAGYCRPDGYIRLVINQKPYFAHRVAYCIYYGIWPEVIDHINGFKNDNKISNLKASNWAENSKNMKRAKNNTSGVTGVYFHKKANKWNARIDVRGKTKHLGLFEKLDNAIIARKLAEKNYDFQIIMEDSQKIDKKMVERSFNIYKNLSNDCIQRLIDPYIRIFNYKGYMKIDYIPRFTKLLNEKLRRCEMD